MLVRIAYVLTYWFMIVTNPAMWRFFAPFIVFSVVAGGIGYYIGAHQ